MDKVLSPVLGSGVAIFLDDLLVYNPDFDSHMTMLAKIVTLLQENSLKLNMSKCMIGMRELTFLGFRISDNGMTPDPETSRAMLQLHQPTNRKEAGEAGNSYPTFRPLRSLLQTFFPTKWSLSGLQSARPLSKNSSSD